MDLALACPPHPDMPRDRNSSSGPSAILIEERHAGKWREKSKTLLCRERKHLWAFRNNGLEFILHTRICPHFLFIPWATTKKPNSAVRFTTPDTAYDQPAGQMSFADLQGGEGCTKSSAQHPGSRRDSVTVNLFFFPFLNCITHAYSHIP